MERQQVSFYSFSFWKSNTPKSALKLFADGWKYFQFLFEKTLLLEFDINFSRKVFSIWFRIFFFLKLFLNTNWADFFRWILSFIQYPLEFTSRYTFSIWVQNDYCELKLKEKSWKKLSENINLFNFTNNFFSGFFFYLSSQ